MDTSIRSADSGDAAAMAAIYRPIVESTTISFEETPPDAAEMARRLHDSAEAGYPWLVACRNDEACGYAYASRHRERACYRYSVDVSVYVAAEARAKGVASALYGELFTQLKRLGFHRAFAGIALPNDASLALHHRFGFEPVGVYREVGMKFGRWLDVYWCQRPI